MDQAEKAKVLVRLKEEWSKAVRRTFPDATEEQCAGLSVQLMLACYDVGMGLYVND